uniref:Corticotropin-releasing factor domain-containing protein n=1 Tax=Eptatretus burgeri TaxID=7764 RepID=A0A8C4R5G8_EPTBU
MKASVLRRMAVLFSVLLTYTKLTHNVFDVCRRAVKKGTKFALSVDVPTNILSVLIDLAKANDLRSKAAANAELMARIGRRK